jgi:hypothetical protein
VTDTTIAAKITHPIITKLKPVPSVVAIGLIVAIPDYRIRYIVAALLALHFAYILWITKKPSRKLRQRLMVYYIDKAVRLCDDAQQAENLLELVEMRLNECD